MLDGKINDQEKLRVNIVCTQFLNYLLLAIMPSTYLMTASLSPKIFASRSSSAATFFCAPAKTSSALSRGITTTPSISQTMMSPGFTDAPPHEIGRFVAPGPFLLPEAVVVPRTNTG